VNNRSRFGYLCVLLAFALVIALGTGYLEPIGMTSRPSSGADLLRGMAPSIGLAVVLFVLGLWLLKGSHRK
jgi:hypothetical protein